VAADGIEPRRYGRRVFLGVLAGGLTSFAWAPAASRILSPLTSAGSQLLGNVFPVGGWRIYTISGSMPVFDPINWSLTVDGLVERPLKLSYDDVRRLPATQQVSTFHCVTGWTVHDVHWRGVRLHHILELAAPLKTAHALRFVSSEHPYEDSLTMKQALLPDVMLALDLDGSPLSRPHGAPMRLVIPEMYGYKGVKWVERIEVVAEQPTGYWENLGYDQNAWVGRSNGYG
jgi:DMSO/TMAO reductase YedYZ molybdopterin-dependent catalytic subunit